MFLYKTFFSIENNSIKQMYASSLIRKVISNGKSIGEKSGVPIYIKKVQGVQRLINYTLTKYYLSLSKANWLIYFYNFL